MSVEQAGARSSGQIKEERSRETTPSEPRPPSPVQVTRNGVTKIATAVQEPATVSTNDTRPETKTEPSPQDDTRPNEEELPKQPSTSEQVSTPKTSSQEKAEKSNKEEVDTVSDGGGGGGQWGSMFGRLRKMVATSGDQQEPPSPVGKLKVRGIINAYTMQY